MPEIKLPTSSQLNQLLQIQRGIEPIFGVAWDKSSNPVLTRIADSEGMVASVGVDGQLVKNDFDTAPILGDMKEVVDTLSNVFIRIPKFYIKKVDIAGFKSFQVSKQRYHGFYLPWCFYDFTNGKELDYLDVGKYKASLGAGNVLESKPNLFPLINQNIVNFRTYAKNNNANGLLGYQQLDIHTVDVLRTLMIIEFATLNSQSVMQGFTTGQYSSSHTAVLTELESNRIVVTNAVASLYRVGQAISVGTSLGGNQIFYGRTITAINVVDANNQALVFDGPPVDITEGNIVYNTGSKNGFSRNIIASSGSIASNSDGKYPCVYRGIESPYGDLWQFVDGVNIDENQSWVAKNAEDYTSNLFASPYQQLSYINSNTNGFVKEKGFDINNPHAEFATDITGSSSTFYCDNYFQSTGQRIALFGGGWDSGSSAGFSSWRLSNSSSLARVNVGGRLLKKPL